MNFQRTLLACLAATAACGVALAPAFGPAQAADSVEPALALAADDPGLAWGPCPAFLPAGCAIAVLHGDPSQPNADILLRVPGGSAIPLHTHASAERMVLVGGELLVTYEGQAQARLTPARTRMDRRAVRTRDAA